MKAKTVDMIGWFASIMAIAMYLSYIDQIQRNLGGHPGSIIQPGITIINCTAWVLYGIFKTPRDWPIVICNFPGILLGSITLITALI